jgi:hypothetical protein
MRGNFPLVTKRRSPRTAAIELINGLQELTGDLVYQTHSHRRLPWVVASLVTPAVSLTIYVIGRYAIFAGHYQADPSAFSTIYSIASVVGTVLVALLVANLFSRRFEYPIMGNVHIDGRSSTLVPLALAAAVSVVALASAAEAAIDGGIINLTFIAFFAFGNSIIEGVAIVALIIAGAANRRISA